MSNRKYKGKLAHFVFALVLVGGSSQLGAFTYEQNFVPYKNGVISRLNGGGVHKTSAKAMRGMATGLSMDDLRFTSPQSTQVSQKDVAAFDVYKNGVFSVAADRTVYFSPDGENLTGGGLTRSLATLSDSPVSVVALSSQVLVLGSKTIFIFNKPETGSGYSSFSRGDVKFLDSANNYIFIQRNSGAVEYTQDPWAIYSSERQKVTIISDGSDLRQVVSYNRGFAAMSGKGIYYAQHPMDILSSSKAKFIALNTANISSIGNQGGDASNTKVTVTVDKFVSGKVSSRTIHKVTVNDGATKGLLVATRDGKVLLSANGDNPGGVSTKTRALANPVRTMASMDVITADLTKQSATYDPTQFFNSVLPKFRKKHTVMLHKGQELVVDESLAIAAKETLAIKGVAYDVTGAPAQVRLYDKGWTNWEYKWRDRGVRSGKFELSTDQVLGKAGIKIRAESDNIVVAVISLEVLPTVNSIPEGLLTLNFTYGASLALTGLGIDLTSSSGCPELPLIIPASDLSKSKTYWPDTFNLPNVWPDKVQLKNDTDVISYGLTAIAFWHLGDQYGDQQAGGKSLFSKWLCDVNISI